MPRPSRPPSDLATPAYIGVPLRMTGSEVAELVGPHVHCYVILGRKLYSESEARRCIARLSSLQPPPSKTTSSRSVAS